MNPPASEDRPEEGMKPTTGRRDGTVGRVRAVPRKQRCGEEVQEVIDIFRAVIRLFVPPRETEGTLLYLF